MTDMKCEILKENPSGSTDVAQNITEVEKQIINIHDDSLLFRIYDKEQDRLMYPEFSELGVTFGESPDGVNYPKDASDFLFDICAWDGKRYVAEKCTGLRDATGRSIYENDEFEVDGQTWRIVYIERNASFFALNLSTNNIVGLNDPLINIDEIVISGNIHHL